MNNQTEIQSVVFRPDKILEITFLDERDRKDHAALVQVLMFDQELVTEQVNSMRSLAQEIIETVHDHLRNVPDRIPMRPQ